MPPLSPTPIFLIEEPTFLLREFRTLYNKIGSLGRGGEGVGGGVVVLGLVMIRMGDLLSW